MQISLFIWPESQKVYLTGTKSVVNRHGTNPQHPGGECGCSNQTAGCGCFLALFCGCTGLPLCLTPRDRPRLFPVACTSSANLVLHCYQQFLFLPLLLTGGGAAWSLVTPSHMIEGAGEGRVVSCTLQAACLRLLPLLCHIWGGLTHLALVGCAAQQRKTFQRAQMCAVDR